MVKKKKETTISVSTFNRYSPSYKLNAMSQARIYYRLNFKSYITNFIAKESGQYV
jgi:hypothetical protein